MASKWIIVFSLISTRSSSWVFCFLRTSNSNLLSINSLLISLRTVFTFKISNQRSSLSSFWPHNSQSFLMFYRQILPLYTFQWVHPTPPTDPRFDHKNWTPKNYFYKFLYIAVQLSQSCTLSVQPNTIGTRTLQSITPSVNIYVTHFTQKFVLHLRLSVLGMAKLINIQFVHQSGIY